MVTCRCHPALGARQPAPKWQKSRTGLEADALGRFAYRLQEPFCPDGRELESQASLSGSELRYWRPKLRDGSFWDFGFALPGRRRGAKQPAVAAAALQCRKRRRGVLAAVCCGSGSSSVYRLPVRQLLTMCTVIPSDSFTPTRMSSLPVLPRCVDDDM